MSSAHHALGHLPPFAACLGRLMARPRVMVIASVVALSGLGWLWLGLMAAQYPDPWSALCAAATSRVTSGAEFALLLSMWVAMVLAMMLPSAAPMILTYTEIADTAARKAQRIVSPLVLTAGYVVVWLGFATAAALAQGLLSRELPPSPLLAGAAFVAAGLYQFSALKQACLRLCRQPFQFFFTNWRTTRGGVFGLGLRQGVYCLGCCWAMMGLMLVVGAMNVIWMAALGIAMTVEKMAGEIFRRVLGGALIAVGGASMLSAFSIL